MPPSGQPMSAPMGKETEMMKIKKISFARLLHVLKQAGEDWGAVPPLPISEGLARSLARLREQGLSPEKAARVLERRRLRRIAAAVEAAIAAMDPETVEEYDLRRFARVIGREIAPYISPREVPAFLELWLRAATPGRPVGSSYNPLPEPFARGFRAIRRHPSLARRIAHLEGRPLREIVEAMGRMPLGARRSRAWAALRAWMVHPDLPFRVAFRAGRMGPRGRLAVAIAWNYGRRGDDLWAFAREILDRPVRQWPIPWWRHLIRRLLWAAGLRDPDLNRATARVLEKMNRDTPERARFLFARLSPRALADADAAGLGPEYGLRLGALFGRRLGEFLRRARTGGLEAHHAANLVPLDLPAEHAEEIGDWLLAHAHELGGLSYGDQDRVRQALSRWAELRAILIARYGNVREAPARAVAALIARAEIRDVPAVPLAEEMARWGIRWGAEIYRRWIRAVVVPPAFPTDRQWRSGELAGRFLPRWNPRGLFLGFHTGCCQRPGDQAESSAWHGTEDPLGGFFVVEDPRGRILAMSWAWWRPGEGVCFDNIEAVNDLPRGAAARIVEIYEAAARDLAAEGYGRVTVGQGYSKVRGDWPEALPPLVPPRGVYTDAARQWELARGEATRRPSGGPYEARVAFPEELPQGLEAIAAAAYPEGWQFVSPGDLFLLLFHREGEGRAVVGYAAIGLEGREVTDVAVLPAHRGAGGMALLAALEAVLRALDPERPWFAAAREATSYRLLRALAARGRLEILADAPDPEAAMDGRPMRRVAFCLKDPGGRAAEAVPAGVVAACPAPAC